MNIIKNPKLRAGLIRVGVPFVLACALGCATTLPVDQQVADSNLTTAVGTKLSLDPEIDRYRIDIDTVNGVVTLRGSVANADQRSDAERIVEGSEGVREVVNHLEIEPASRTPSAQFEDAWIVAMISSKLAVDPEVHSRNVDVDVRAGVVTLSGIVETDIAKTEAGDLARSVDGVERVVNELQVGG